MSEELMQKPETYESWTSRRLSGVNGGADMGKDYKHFNLKAFKNQVHNISEVDELVNPSM